MSDGVNARDVVAVSAYIERLEGRLRGSGLALDQLDNAWWLDRTDAHARERHERRLCYAKGYNQGLHDALVLAREGRS